MEIKSGLSPKTERGFHHARADLHPTRSFVVYAGHERFPLGDGIEAISLADMAKELRGMS